MNKILEIIETADKSGLKMRIDFFDVKKEDISNIIKQEQTKCDGNFNVTGWTVSNKLSVALWSK